MRAAMLRWDEISPLTREKLTEKGISMYSEFFTPQKDVKPKSNGRKRTVTTNQQKRAKIKRKNKSKK